MLAYSEFLWKNSTPSPKSIRKRILMEIVRKIIIAFASVKIKKRKDIIWEKTAAGVLELSSNREVSKKLISNESVKGETKGKAEYVIKKSLRRPAREEIIYRIYSLIIRFAHTTCPNFT